MMTLKENSQSARFRFRTATSRSSSHASSVFLPIGRRTSTNIAKNKGTYSTTALAQHRHVFRAKVVVTGVLTLSLAASRACIG